MVDYQQSHMGKPDTLKWQQSLSLRVDLWMIFKKNSLMSFQIFSHEQVIFFISEKFLCGSFEERESCLSAAPLCAL